MTDWTPFQPPYHPFNTSVSVSGGPEGCRLTLIPWDWCFFFFAELQKNPAENDEVRRVRHIMELASSTHRNRSTIDVVSWHRLGSVKWFIGIRLLTETENGM